MRLGVASKRFSCTKPGQKPRCGRGTCDAPVNLLEGDCAEVFGDIKVSGEKPSPPSIRPTHGWGRRVAPRRRPITSCPPLEGFCEQVRSADQRGVHRLEGDQVQERHLAHAPWSSWFFPGSVRPKATAALSVVGVADTGGNSHCIFRRITPTSTPCDSRYSEVMSR